MTNPTNKEITDYFRANIFESLSFYSAWKMLDYSKSTGVVSKEMAVRYVEIQNYHKSFFITTGRAHLIAFVIQTLHSFDRNENSYSLFKVDEKEVGQFLEQNSSVIKELRSVRNKVFAHKDSRGNPQKYKIPSLIRLDAFFKNLVELYNRLTRKVSNSTTMFDNAEGIKRDIELMFMNLYRGENIRLKEIDIEWLWEKDDSKASDIL